MPRSKSLRKALIAVLVLVTFMIILRYSKPESKTNISKSDSTKESQYQDSKELKDSLLEFARLQEEELKAKGEYPDHGNKQAGNTLQDSKDSTHSRDSTVHKESEFSKDRTLAEHGSQPVKENNVNEETPNNSDFDVASMFSKLVKSPDSAPVIIFSKSYCGFSLRAKKLLLEAYNIVPPPKVVELDQIDHGTELQSYLHKETGRGTVPNIFVNGISRGGSSDLDDLGSNLISKFTEWGQGKLSIVVREAEVQEKKL